MINRPLFLRRKSKALLFTVFEAALFAVVRNSTRHAAFKEV